MRKEKPLIEIRPAALSEGLNEFDFTCMAAEFKDPKLEEAGFTGPVRVKVTAVKAVDEIDVTITTEASAAFSCDLCLAPLQRTLEGTYRLFFGWGNPPEESDEEYRSLDRNAVSIDLTEDVRETVLLSRPMKVTCIDNPECRVYGRDEEEEDDIPGQENSSWKESLEKLKGKYR